MMRERMEHIENAALHAHCEAWVQWCLTRKFFLPPGAKNILARMQPSRVGQPPNAILSDDLSFFNMAVHALADMKDQDAECFVEYYWNRAKNIKAVAARMDIARRTFYERRDRFARKAMSMAASLKRVQQERTPTALEVEEIVD